MTVIAKSGLVGETEKKDNKYFALFDMPATRKGAMSGYTSWYNYFQKIDESIILAVDAPIPDTPIKSLKSSLSSFVANP